MQYLVGGGVGALGGEAQGGAGELVEEWGEESEGAGGVGGVFGQGGLPGVSRTVVDCVGQAALLLLTKSCSASPSSPGPAVQLLLCGLSGGVVFMGW